jgi:hypothetical protein
LPFPLPFASAAASAGVLPSDACNAALRVSLLTRLDQQDSWLGLLLLAELLAELVSQPWSRTRPDAPGPT